MERWSGINEIVPTLKLTRSSVKNGGSERNSSGAKALSFSLEKPLFIKEENVIHNKT